MKRLLEDKRQELINKSKHADNYVIDQSKGKNRYERRLQSRILNSVKEFNKIDMNTLFKDNILLVNVNIAGETNNYIVKIKFGSILNYIHDQLTSDDQKVDLRIITRALVSAFNSDDVYIHCDCPDFLYRFSYWSLVNNISSDPEIEQKNNGREIVNPNDTKGRGCKHVLLVLTRSRWLRNVASVIYNYINYMEKHYPKLYADIIYPAIYEKEYEEPVQLSIDDLSDEEKEVPSEEDTIDTSNKWAKTKNQFKPGNEYRFQPTNKEIEGQKSFDFDSLMSD